MYTKLAFYCRFAAAQQGVKAMDGLNAAEGAEAGAFLGALIGRIESDRGAFGIVKEEEAADLKMVEHQALRLFSAADKSDRGGQAGRDTIRAFSGAAAFMDAVRALDAGHPNLANMSIYAKKRAMAIFGDIKAGRQPAPPEGALGERVELEGGAGVRPPPCHF
jgi:hypothetical protein